jgi:transposase
MTLEQLTLLVKFLRGDMNGLAVKAAKLVLIDGLSQADAARQLGTRTNTVNNGVKRYSKANEEIKKVYGINN